MKKPFQAALRCDRKGLLYPDISAFETLLGPSNRAKK
jgi:hypothetical protein